MTASVFQRVLLCALPLFSSTGCVTINVYLPTKQIQEAAKEIVDEVRPEIDDDGSPGIDPGGASGAADREEARASGVAAPAVAGSSALAAHVAVLLVGVPTAQDDSETPKKKLRLNISTPKIKAIKKTLKKRYPKLYPFYVKRAVGEGFDGYLALRSDKGLGLKGRRDLKLLLEKENEDRKQLYEELALANKIDKKEVPSIGRLFSGEWQKKCKTGWWIQGKKGKWAKKKPPKKKPGKGDTPGSK